MESIPDLPSHNPPPIPLGLPTSDYNNSYRGQQITPTTTEIPDAILYEIAKQQYRNASKSFHQPRTKKAGILTLLEISEQCLEDAKTFLEARSFDKSASSYIKGYTIFKFTEKLNKDPSNADIIATLRNLYSRTSFTKLKEIVDETYITQREKHLTKMTASSVTLVEAPNQIIHKDIYTAEPDPAFSDSKPRTLAPPRQPAPAPPTHRYYYHAEPEYVPAASSYNKRAPPSIPAPAPPSIPVVPPIVNFERPRQPPPAQYHSSSHSSRSSYHGDYQRKTTIPPSFSICGLQNFGNTCYLNSLIQCLYNFKAFSHFFKSNAYVDFVHGVSGTPDSICLSYSLGSLFRVMEKHSGSTIAPTRFFGFLLQVSGFKQYEQQDVQEALLIIMNRLHEELSNNDLTALSFPKTFSHYSNDPEYEKWFEAKLRHEKLSPINGFFEGQQETALRCESCGFASKSYSSFNVLSLNLPRSARGSTAIAVEELINFYTSTEQMKGTQSWDCPECKKGRERAVEFEKEMMAQRHYDEQNSLKSNNNSTSDLFDPPEKESKSKSFFKRKIGKTNHSNDLVASLKTLQHTQTQEIRAFEERLQQEANSAISRRSTRILALPSYLVLHIQRSVKGARLSTNINYPLILEIHLGSGERVRFKLQSTVNHSGTSANSGHYTALCNKSDHLTTPRWCHFNDEQFIPDMVHGDLLRGIQRVMSHDVYLLFYERIES